MTELQAINKSIEMWEWLFENFPKNKDAFDIRYPESKINNYEQKCPLCHYHFYCSNCCLEEKFNCWNKNHAFHKWNNYVKFSIGSKTKAKNAAKKILKKLIKRQTELKGVKQ